jgi:hypothetical protein
MSVISALRSSADPILDAVWDLARRLAQIRRVKTVISEYRNLLKPAQSLHAQARG